MHDSRVATKVGNGTKMGCAPWPAPKTAAAN